MRNHLPKLHNGKDIIVPCACRWFKEGGKVGAVAVTLVTSIIDGVVCRQRMSRAGQQRPSLNSTATRSLHWVRGVVEKNSAFLGLLMILFAQAHSLVSSLKALATIRSA